MMSLLKSLEPRAAEREHRAALVIDDLDAHAFRRHVEQDLVLELRERLALVDALSSALHQAARRSLSSFSSCAPSSSGRVAVCTPGSAALSAQAVRDRGATPCRRRA
jgi:hypothetical protein